MAYPFASLELARQLERTEAHANRRSVEARAREFPASHAEWIDIDGAYAMFDGVGSPLTQTFGLGMFHPLTSTALDRVETFFLSRGAEVFHEVSPLADASVVPLLTARHYEPFEFSSVMFRPLEGLDDLPGVSGVSVRAASAADLPRWATTSAEGWSEYPELASFMRDLAQVAASTVDGRQFLAESDGLAIATALSIVHEKVVLLAGASTIPGARRRGAQRALLQARLKDAAARGAELAMICAQPGSDSQRNAERQGFRIAYTRIKWRRRSASA